MTATATTPDLAQLHAELAAAQEDHADAEAAVRDALFDTGDAYDGDPTHLIEHAARLAKRVADLKAAIADQATGPDCGA
ncbi:hypothetical protein [Glycomyces sp. YM15]|uniref:hypothetical protein n=1 Tax=Glycomyces sp. YM15 TaxID=2800446 RepID=UPI00196532A8|nr:hypothetical protein [Glycomyces sp. YM15]